MSTRRKIIKAPQARLDPADIDSRPLNPRRVLHLDERHIHWVQKDDTGAAPVLARVLHQGEAEDRIKPYVVPDLNDLPETRAKVSISIEDAAPDEPDEATDTEESDATEALIESMRADWEAEAEAAWTVRLNDAVREAREEGYSLGCEDTRGAMLDEVDEARSAIDKDVALFRDAWTHFIRKAEPALVEMTFEIAEALIDQVLPDSYKVLSERALLEALDEFAGQAPLEVSLHSVDLLRLKENGVIQRIEELHPGICWEPKPSIREGDWVAQSPKKAIRRITDELILNLKDRFGTRDTDLPPDPSTTASPDPSTELPDDPTPNLSAGTLAPPQPSAPEAPKAVDPPSPGAAASEEDAAPGAPDDPSPPAP